MNIKRNLHFKLKSIKNFSSIERIFDKKKALEYRDKGFTVLPKVFPVSLIDELQAEIDKIINSANVQEIKSIFDAGHLKTDKYFLDSGDKVNNY
jgi:hypothetical protein